MNTELTNEINEVKARIDEIKTEIKDIKDFLSDYSLEIVEEYDLTSARLYDVAQEVASNSTDIYTSDLNDWLENCSKSYEYMEQARSEFGTSEYRDDDIRNAQYLCILDQIYRELNDIKEIIDLTEELEELEEELKELEEELAEEQEQVA